MPRQVGNTHICPNVRWPGFGTYGGFGEYIPVAARYVIKVAKHLKFEELAPLIDAGLTPYCGLKKIRDAGGLGPDRGLGVFGVGGLGAYAVQYAKLLGAGATVVAFARNPDKLAIAKKYGADHTITRHAAQSPPYFRPRSSNSWWWSATKSAKSREARLRMNADLFG